MSDQPNSLVQNDYHPPHTLPLEALYAVRTFSQQTGNIALAEENIAGEKMIELVLLYENERFANLSCLSAVSTLLHDERAQSLHSPDFPLLRPQASQSQLTTSRMSL